jgi:hypothetical protein
VAATWHAVDMRAVIPAALYLGVVVGVMVLFNAGFAEAQFLWLAASFVLGWVTRNPWLTLLPLLAVPIAAPFGYADTYVQGDPMPIWAEVAFWAPVHALTVLVACGGRGLYERRRGSRAGRRTQVE